MEKYKPVVEKLAVYGCYSIAVVYFMVGIIALMSFLGVSEDAADEERIMDMLMELPLGEVLIGVVVLGLIGYIIWRVFEAIIDPYNFGNDKKGLARRIGIALSAVGYGVIAFSAIQMLIQGGGNGEDDQQLIVSQVLDLPAGAWIVGAAGVIMAFVGFVQFKYVAGGDYNKRLQYDKMPNWILHSSHILAWAGYIARGIILGIIGYFLLYAAIMGDAGEVGDTDSAFDFLGDFGFIGKVLFVAVAIGTMGYGFFMVIHGYYYSFEED